VRYPAEQLTKAGSAASCSRPCSRARLAADAAKDPCSDGEREGRYGGSARRADRDYGQSLRTRQYTASIAWDPTKAAITVAKDWVAYEVRAQ